ncbi:haloacid dehalogenase type II [Bacillus sp. FJAT-42376]|uniref:haloacid dehalogenase type II n=1 Tax=Bacillus sp. FJAT-42376 TaxID=2014076 RepID=UPI0013DDFA98|nr:haloacid dehalogenase type II [Bacillus sp. FJAT-42376]
MTVKTILFDAYGTLFDVYSVKEKCEQYFKGKGEAISRTWREKQLEYCFLSQILQAYKPFDDLTKKALVAALDIHQVHGSGEIMEDLMKAYEQLSPYEETEEVLTKLKDKQTFIYSNGTQGMLDPLVRNSGLENLLGILSADEVRQYKPSPSAYQYAMDKLGLHKTDILFVSSNQWDIAGASSFGFKTAWVNRKEEPVSRMGFKPAIIVSDLRELLEEI